MGAEPGAKRGAGGRDRRLDAALLDAVLAAATDYSIVATDPNGIVTVFNSGAERMLGYAAAEMVGRRTPEVFHDRAEVARRAAELGIEPGFDVFVTAARMGQSETREWTYLRKDGSTLPVALSVSAVVRDGQPVGFLGIARDLSDQKQAQRELEASAKRFATVFGASPVPTIITRVRDGLILMANPACLAFLGWEADEFVGRTVVDVQLRVDPERRASMVDRLRADGRIQDMEEEVRTRDGRVLQVLASLQLIELDDEPCIVCLMHDVTERTRLETALRDSEQRLRGFLDHAPAMVWMMDREGRFTLINRRTPEELGLVADDVIGRTGHDVLPADMARALDEAYTSAPADAAPARFEARLMTVSGEERDYQFVKFPLFSAEGDIDGVGMIATDVTPTKRAHDAIRESEERFRQLAESIDIGFVLHSVDPPEILYASPRVEAITGVPATELRRDPGALLAAIHPEDRDAIAARMTAASATDAQSLEYRVVAADGAVRWLRMRMRPARDGSGEVTCVASTIEDITSWKVAEVELQVARAEADRANLAKSDFLSRMSHELRTPLHAILGFSELLELEPLTPEQQDSVGHVRQAGRHLLALIDEILDISRIESGQLALSLEPVQLGELVREAVEIVGPLAARRRLALETEFEDEGAFVLADRQRLKQVLLNLLSNAVKYNREGGQIRVACRRRDADRLRIVISDTGIGIPEASLGRLFMPFERLGAEHSAVEGTGLGLALSRRLVEAMRGTIGVESQVGEGTTFWIDLDRTGAPDHQAAPPAHVPAPGSRAVAGTVLCIEDNLPNLQLVERILARRPGVALLSAMQGTLGLELAASHQPGLILLDLNLPDMPGLEVLRRLRARPATARTPIVVASADATRRQVERVIANGANDYLTKPIQVERLLAWVDRALGEPKEGPDHGPPGAGHASPAGSRVGASVLDHAQLGALRDLDDSGDALRRIAELFLRDAPPRVESLARAASDADAAAVREAAHSLRGSARTIGAPRLATVAETIERAARRGELPDAATLAALERALEEARAAVSAHVAGV